VQYERAQSRPTDYRQGSKCENVTRRHTCVKAEFLPVWRTLDISRERLSAEVGRNAIGLDEEQQVARERAELQRAIVHESHYPLHFTPPSVSVAFSCQLLLLGAHLVGSNAGSHND
jgi:hypothetical protein